MKITLPMLNDFLMQDRWTPHHPDIPFIIRTSVDHIECEDGFKVSVQAGEHNYSKPRSNGGPWTEFECGMPSVPVPEWQDRLDGDQYDDHTKGVFAYVDADRVIEVLMQHGGPTEAWLEENLLRRPIEYVPMHAEHEAECRLAPRIHSHDEGEKCWRAVALVERSAGFLLFCDEHRWVTFASTEAK